MNCYTKMIMDDLKVGLETALKVQYKMESRALGPDYHLVNAIDFNSFEVTDNHGKRVGVYWSAELAHKVRKNADELAMRDYLKAQRKARKAAQ